MSLSASVLPSSIAGSLWHAGKTVCHNATESLARQLICRAWSRALATGRAVKPWQWADIWPVAQLEAPRQGEQLMVIAGASGRKLAFGPGHVDGTPLPGEAGNAVISGHRNTHFAFLRDVRSGDLLVVHTLRGRVVRYVVSGIEVVRNKDVRVLLDVGEDRLTLMTCYPFHSRVPGGSLRYVVVAKRVDAAVTGI